MEDLPTSSLTSDEQEINFHETGSITFSQHCVQVWTGFSWCAWNTWQHDGKLVFTGGEFSAEECGGPRIEVGCRGHPLACWEGMAYGLRPIFCAT